MTTEEIAELAHYAETVYGMVVGDVNNKFWSTLSIREKDAYVEATRMRLVNQDMSVPEVDEVTGKPLSYVEKTKRMIHATVTARHGLRWDKQP